MMSENLYNEPRMMNDPLGDDDRLRETADRLHRRGGGPSIGQPTKSSTWGHLLVCYPRNVVDCVCVRYRLGRDHLG